MRFDVITLFPELFAPHQTCGVTRRAYDSGAIELKLWPLREHADGREVLHTPRTPQKLPAHVERGNLMKIENHHDVRKLLQASQPLRVLGLDMDLGLYVAPSVL